MKYKSYPKINLFLCIGKKNTTINLHEIRSIFLLVKNDIYDEIEIEFSKNTADKIVYLNNNKEMQFNDCIFKKALSILRRENYLNKEVFFNIKIIKNILPFTGVGIGSSNVACLFKFLLQNKLITFKQIKKIILEVGSDVMFFVRNYDCAYVFGYGQKVWKMKSPQILIKLFFTNIKCSTKEVFNSFENKKKPNNKKYYLKQILYFKIKKYHMLKNDLEETVLCLYKDLSSKKNEIEQNNKDEIYLSGSGGTLFSIKPLNKENQNESK